MKSAAAAAKPPPAQVSLTLASVLPPLVKPAKAAPPPNTDQQAVKKGMYFHLIPAQLLTAAARVTLYMVVQAAPSPALNAWAEPLLTIKSTTAKPDTN